MAESCMAVCFTQYWNMSTNISQGSVVTYLRNKGIFNY